MHQMRRSDDEVLHARFLGKVERLGNRVDLLAITGGNMIDDNLGGEGATDGPLGERRGDSLLNTADGGNAVVIERGAKAHDENLVLLVGLSSQRIVLGGITRVETEVVGFLDKFLLGVSQGVPSFLGGFAVSVGRCGALLDLDLGDKLVNCSGCSSVGAGRCACRCAGRSAGRAGRSASGSG